jgi:hypothetical protein
MVLKLSHGGQGWRQKLLLRQSFSCCYWALLVLLVILAAFLLPNLGTPPVIEQLGSLSTIHWQIYSCHLVATSNSQPFLVTSHFDVKVILDKSVNRLAKSTLRKLSRLHQATQEEKIAIYISQSTLILTFSLTLIGSLDIFSIRYFANPQQLLLQPSCRLVDWETCFLLACSVNQRVLVLYSTF